MQDSKPRPTARRTAPVQMILGIDSLDLDDLTKRQFYCKFQFHPYSQLKFKQYAELSLNPPRMRDDFIEKLKNNFNSIIEITFNNQTFFTLPEIQKKLSDEYLIPRIIRSKKITDDKIQYIVEYWSDCGPEWATESENPNNEKLIAKFKKNELNPFIPLSFNDKLIPNQRKDLKTILEGYVLSEDQYIVANNLIKFFFKSKNILITDTKLQKGVISNDDFNAEEDNPYVTAICAAMKYIQLTYGSPGLFLLVCPPSKIDIYQKTFLKLTDLVFAVVQNKKCQNNFYKTYGLSSGAETTTLDVLILSSQTFHQYLNPIIENNKNIKFSLTIFDSVENIYDTNSEQYNFLMNSVNARSFAVIESNSNINQQQNFIKTIYTIIIKTYLQDYGSIDDIPYDTKLKEVQSHTVKLSNSEIPMNNHIVFKTIFCEMSQTQINEAMEYISSRANSLGKEIENSIKEAAHFLSQKSLYSSKPKNPIFPQLPNPSGKCEILQKYLQYLEENNEKEKQIIICAFDSEFFDFLDKYITNNIVVNDNINYFKAPSSTNYNELNSIFQQFTQSKGQGKISILFSKNPGKLLPKSDIVFLFSFSNHPNKDKDIILNSNAKECYRIISHNSFEEEYYKYLLIQHKTNPNFGTQTEQVNQIPIQILQLLINKSLRNLKEASQGNDTCKEMNYPNNYFNNFNHFLKENFQTIVEKQSFDESTLDNINSYSELCSDSSFSEDFYNQIASDYDEFKRQFIMAKGRLNSNFLHKETVTNKETPKEKESPPPKNEIQQEKEATHANNEIQQDRDPILDIKIESSEIVDWSSKIQKKGLLNALKEAPGNGLNPKINFIPTALMYASYNYLTDKEKEQINFMELLNSIPVSPPLSPTILQKDPFNNKDFIISLFTTLQQPSSLVLSQDDKSQPNSQTESFYWNRMNILASTDLHNRLMSYYIFLIKKQKPLHFAECNEPPIWWNSLFDFYLIKDRNVDTTITKIKHMYLDLKNIQVDKKKLINRRTLLKNEITRIIPSSFYSTEYELDDDDFIKNYQEKIETIPSQILKHFIRAMYLIQPEPFDTISERLKARTLFKFTQTTLQRYAEMLAQFVDYKQFNYDPNYVNSIFGGLLTTEYQNILRRNMKLLSSMYKNKDEIQQNSLDEKLYAYTGQNGLISICEMKDVYPDQFQSVDSEILKKTIIQERLNIKPIAPQGIGFALKKFEDINAWIAAIEKSRIKIQLVQIKQKMIEISQEPVSPRSQTKIIGNTPKPFGSISKSPLYLINIGKFDMETDILLSYEAIRVINGKVITMSIENTKRYVIIVEEDKKEIFKIIEESIGQCFFNFALRFYKLYNYRIDMSPTEFFGFENKVFRSIISFCKKPEKKQ